jgi:putative phage-type endonuclease
MEIVSKATQLGVFESGSPEWHQLRAMGIGGSEVSTICGLNRWESAYTLWAKKTGRINGDLKQSEPMFWGSRLESIILDEFARRNPNLYVDAAPGTWHGENIWEIANPDAVFRDENGEFGIVEVKTAAYADDWVLPAEGMRGTSDGVPRYYLTQVQWYLRIMGYKRAVVVALFSGNKYREFDVVADRFQQYADFDLVQQFWQNVQDDKQPDWDGSMSTYETVRALHPDIDDSDIELGGLGSAYVNALEAQALTEGAVNRLKSMILDNMGQAKRGLVDGVVVVKRQAGRNGAAPYLVKVSK